MISPKNKSLIIRTFLVSFLLFGMQITTFSQPVFPGAIGFGANTIAGRGGTVYRVTNLNNDGPGSFRWAVSQSEPRVVIFEVSGTILLNSDVNIWNPYLTIAGQTAPSPGITLRAACLVIRSHDMLVQHIRIRSGDINITGSPCCISITNYDDPSSMYNIIIDHCSLSWSESKIISIWSNEDQTPLHDITINNCILSESLYGIGSSIAITTGPHQYNISIIENLFAHNNHRNPVLHNGIKAIVLNNLVYNAGWRNIHFYGPDPHEVTICGNQAIPGPSSQVGIDYMGHMHASPPEHLPVSPLSQIYVEENLCVNWSWPDDHWDAFENDVGESIKANSPPIWIFGLQMKPAYIVNDLLTEWSGARPADRDVVDNRIIAELANGTGEIIDSQDDVGGWPVLDENYCALILPPNPSEDDVDDGYTNLEEWLHEYKKEVEGIDKSLIADWRLDEGSRLFCFNSAGGGYRGEIINMPNTGWEEGIKGKCLNFEKNIETHINCGKHHDLRTIKRITIALWLYKANIDSGFLISQDQTNGYSLRVAGNRFMFKGKIGSSEILDFGTDGGIQTGVWQHVAFTHDGDTSKFYIDGNMVYSEVHNGDINGGFVPPNDKPFIIGADSGGGNNFGGKMDEVKIYNRALTKQEIEDYYNITVGINENPDLSCKYPLLKTTPIHSIQQLQFHFL